MQNLITKRNGTRVGFNAEKITNAIKRAGNQTGEFDIPEAKRLTQCVLELIKLNEYDELTVENVQDLVEMVLLKSEYKVTAKAYIIYREKRTQARKPDIFKYRLNLKPYEYPELIEYKEAIQHSYWLHTEFNYTSDIHDFKFNVSNNERNAIKNVMLAIAQVEVAVKTFWGDIYHRLPKPEVGAVGHTFAESEVRHHDAYSHLLEILGLNEEFEKIKEIPVLSRRVDYLTKSAKLARTGENKDYALSILLFSLFIEHVSLFSQFLIIMSFNKYKNIFKGMSNVIEATSKEEQVHGLFGIELINIIRKEHPEWFDKKLENTVYQACIEAYDSEGLVIDWIYESGELSFLPKEIVKEFVKNRLNNSLKSIGYRPVFDVNEKLVDKTDWFDDEIIGTKHGDFFVKRQINYTKRTRSITGDDLF
ncbi:ribonucleotide-diphosphate reductase subunit beta [Paenibacillus sp. EKM102P]|uniref:ribonucleotide-diphosphate reductase subunit beta n=1 Tax=unclassified Paenibacillus TaxID=185978 RepID=UPI00142DE135|nr:MULTISPECIES: ribonucleotide-diphosphate reductase subunit beta [unclassified Paenibacillus]KAF6620592.1 ribonucleotide-diphosphate reductase subunit beta [Paenibacillus sp. EKM101P]KAF6623585.1 ribonucleotide-diphosphate reductase subunit beta [Paenibacillus sp. EKM102P]KAF6633854.1 ribonucleotide-diphosphate reductase subunit beta [Paenibacillus sp. EKM10P]KAF6649379.1 ribonucleotide-diphosphate reductase subunit beta [Paenibacillus sp. EKM11P]